jgi:prepilin-type N-terminal cleavage/methylation domain-containing protein
MQKISGKALDRKAFTLIELLVVVAIIGILAAVGVVAYNGYTTAAKNNAVKQIHKNVAKFMSAEIMKCSIGGEVVLNKLVSNTPTPQADLCPRVSSWTDQNSQFISRAFEYHFKAEKWENPHSIGFTGVSTCGVDVNRKNVSGNLGLTCIQNDFWGKRFLIGTNVSEKGEKMFSTLGVE